jgi:hypothetical protein
VIGERGASLQIDDGASRRHRANSDDRDRHEKVLITGGHAIRMELDDLGARPIGGQTALGDLAAQVLLDRLTMNFPDDERRSGGQHRIELLQQIGGR